MEQDQPEILKELHKKRDEYLDEKSKTKRENILTTKRSLLSEKTEFEKLLEDWQKKEYVLNDFPELSNAIKSDDKTKQHYGVIGIRRLLIKSLESNGGDSMIQGVIDSHLIPKLITLTEKYEDPKLQHEAVWILANMTIGTPFQIQSILNKGGIAAFVRLLQHESPEVSEQAIYAIGNLAVDNSELRNDILKTDATPFLLEIVKKSNDPLLVQKGTWALANLVRGNPYLNFELKQETIQTFSKIVQETQDIDTLIDAARVLSCLADDRGMNLMLESNICQGLVTQIKANQVVRVLAPLLRILGNLLAGAESQTGEALKVPELVDVLVELATSHENKVVVRESCWCLSNITEGNSQQIQTVLKDNEQITNLMKISQRTEPDIKEISKLFFSILFGWDWPKNQQQRETENTIEKEVLRIFSNATKKASPAQMTALDECNILDYFYQYLTHDNPENIKIALDAISNVLNMGAYLALQNKTDNLFLEKFDDKGGAQALEDLQMHENREIYEKALHLIETHYESEGGI